jgi:hypothetical protein
MNGREDLIRLMQGLWSNFISLSSLILHSTTACMVKALGIGKLRRSLSEGLYILHVLERTDQVGVSEKQQLFTTLPPFIKDPSSTYDFGFNPSFLRHMMN